MLAGAVVACSMAARAQKPGRIYRVGGLFQGPWNAPHHVALREELRRFGFIEGQNLFLDSDGHGVRPEQFAEHAVELVRSNVDAINCGGDAAIKSARQATTSIPILGLSDDMVGSGLVRSLAEPGGNITGVSILVSELDIKRQQLLLELFPASRRIAALVDLNTTRPAQLKALQDAAATRGIEVVLQQVLQPNDIASAIDAIKAAGVSAVNVLATALFYNNRHIVLERIKTHRLPAIYQWPEFAQDGGLIAYGPSIVKIYRQQIAKLLAKLLRGARPADLPIEQPTEIDLVVNQRTAKSLGLTIPDSLLARADEVIE